MHVHTDFCFTDNISMRIGYLFANVAWSLTYTFWSYPSVSEQKFSFGGESS